MNKFLAKIASAEKQVGANKTRSAWYRGCHTAAHDLSPSMHRLKLSLRAQHKFENDVFSEFKGSARRYLDTSLLEDSWDYLAAMQHFGVATRLLDWTTELDVALYFALSGVEKIIPGQTAEWPCIWVLNPFRLNSFHMASAPIFDRADPIPYDYHQQIVACARQRATWPHEAGIAFNPGFGNDRITAQHGRFTIHGEWAGPLDKTPCLAGTYPTLKQVLIDPNDWGVLKDHSVRGAAHHLRMFPDISDFVRFLNSRS